MTTYDAARQAADDLMREQWADAVAAARTAGYDAGQETGRAIGYADGHRVGYDEGRSAGYAAGHAAGYAEGYAAGRADCPAGAPDPTMLFGPALGLWPADRGKPYFDKNNAEWGPWGIFRAYQNGNLTEGGPLADANGARIAVEAGVPNLAISIKPGGSSVAQHKAWARGEWDQRIQAWLNKWPEGVGGLLIIDNEPDQVKKNNDPAAFRAAVEHFAQVLDLPPGVKLGIALMEWSWNKGNPRHPGDGSAWLPMVRDLVLGIHFYSESTDSYRPMSEHVGRILRDKPDQWGWFIGETNCPEDPRDPMAKARWFLENTAWAAENGCVAYCPFAATGFAPWNAHLNTSPEAGAALKLIAETYAPTP